MHLKCRKCANQSNTGNLKAIQKILQQYAQVTITPVWPAFRMSISMAKAVIKQSIKSNLACQV